MEKNKRLKTFVVINDTELAGLVDAISHADAAVVYADRFLRNGNANEHEVYVLDIDDATIVSLKSTKVWTVAHTQ